MTDNFESDDNPRASYHAGRDIIVGDKAGRDLYKNITNSTIRSKVEEDPEIREALKRVTEMIEKSDDPAAKSTFKEFTNELNQPQPNKSRLQKFWSALEKILPTVAEVSSKIAPLIAAI